jgi:hypothetical protein
LYFQEYDLDTDLVFAAASPTYHATATTMDTANNLSTMDATLVPAAFADDKATTLDAAAPADEDHNDVIMTDEDNNVMMMAATTDTKNNAATTTTLRPTPYLPDFVFATASNDVLPRHPSPTDYPPAPAKYQDVTTDNAAPRPLPKNPHSFIFATDHRDHDDHDNDDGHEHGDDCNNDDAHNDKHAHDEDDDHDLNNDAIVHEHDDHDDNADDHDNDDIMATDDNDGGAHDSHCEHISFHAYNSSVQNFVDDIFAAVYEEAYWDSHVMNDDDKHGHDDDGDNDAAAFSMLCITCAAAACAS